MTWGLIAKIFCGIRNSYEEGGEVAALLKEMGEAFYNQSQFWGDMP
jgi:hypothetical protein